VPPREEAEHHLLEHLVLPDDHLVNLAPELLAGPLDAADGLLGVDRGRAGLRGHRDTPELRPERDGTTHVPTMTYVLGDDIIAQIAAAAASLRFFVYDGHGSVRLLTNAQGSITDRFAYTAFGNPIGFNPATAATRYLFSGQQYDPVAGLYYMRARLYDPSTGRFTQTDPLSGLTSDALSLHRYVYAESNPVNLSDPSGQHVSLTNQPAQAILGFLTASFAISLAGSALGLFSPLGLITKFYFNAIISIYTAVTVISDIEGVFLDMPYINSLKQNIGKGKVIPPQSAAAQAVLQLRQIGPYVIGLDFGVLTITLSLAVVGELIPFGDVVNLFVAIFQLSANTLFNGLVAVDTMTVLNINYATKGKKPRRGKAAAYTVQTHLSGHLDALEILGESWFGFSADPWEILRSATKVIENAAKLNGSTTGAPAIADKMKDAFEEVVKGLNSDYLKGMATESGNVYQNGQPLTPGFLMVNPSSVIVSPVEESNLISTDDPVIAPLVSEARSLWQTAVGQALPDVPVIVSDLPPDVLAATYVTAWDDQGRPDGYTIVLSPDAAGHGWYVAPAPDDQSAFAQSLTSTAYLAQPGSAAYGHYDLLTALLHEFAHVEGFLPDNPAFESHVQTLGGSQVFVAPGVTAPLVDSEQELDPNVYPGDLMSATLTPGVRELPSPLDVQILDIVSGFPAPPQVQNSTAASTAVVDHAVAALGNDSPASSPPPSVIPAGDGSNKGREATHRKGHRLPIKTKHSGTAPGRKTSSQHVTTKAHLKADGTLASQPPNGSLAVRMSRRGARVTGHSHSPARTSPLGAGLK